MPPPQDPIDAFFSNLFKTIWFWASVACVILGLVVWITWPTWEDKNKSIILSRCDAILDINNDQIIAYQQGDELLKDLRTRNIKSASLVARINEVKELMGKLEPKVRAEIEMRRIDDEKRQAIAKQAEDMAHVKEVEEKSKAEAKVKLIAKYANVSKSAKDALVSLKKLQAFTEVGVTKIKYSEALGIAWGDIKVFVESPEAKKDYVELSKMFTEAIEQYKLASTDWDSNGLRNSGWLLGKYKLEEIDKLINSN